MSFKKVAARFARIPDPFAREAAARPRELDASTLPYSPTRATVRMQRLAALAAVALYQGAWIAAFGLRPDVAGRSAWAIAVQVAPLAVAILALRAAAGSNDRGLARPIASLAALVVVPGALYAVTKLASPGVTAGAATMWATATCSAWATILSVVPLALALLAFRRAFAAAAGWRTAALGVATGALAAATLNLTCANDCPTHVLVGHAAFIVIGGVGAALLSGVTRT